MLQNGQLAIVHAVLYGGRYLWSMHLLLGLGGTGIACSTGRFDIGDSIAESHESGRPALAHWIRIVKGDGLYPVVQR